MENKGDDYKILSDIVNEGNFRAIGRLVEGMPATDVARILAGVDCHGRGTSCTDQLSRVMTKVLG